MNKLDRILENAIQIYGKDLQIIVAIEELSELQKELTKYLRGFDNKKIFQKKWQMLRLF